MFSEALERLLLKRFAYEEDPTIPDRFHDLANINKENLESLLDDESTAFTQTYQRYRSRIRNGTAGKTTQFWMIYHELMEAQVMAHNGVQENNIDMMVKAWQTFLPMYFAFNKVNYTRYGSYYFGEHGTILSWLKRTDLKGRPFASRTRKVSLANSN